jgi:adenylate cyclase
MVAAVPALTLACVKDWTRTPGAGKFARPERERRFLVVGSPPLEGPARLIEDRYVTRTSLRLRRVLVEGDVVLKLTQKIRAHAEDPFDIALTNLYLAAEEYEALCVLPAASLSKTRYLCRVEGVRFAVDEFHGALAGLRLAEVEVERQDDWLPQPDWLGLEVSQDDRYSGGRLAVASSADRRELGLDVEQ